MHANQQEAAFDGIGGGEGGFPNDDLGSYSIKWFSGITALAEGPGRCIIPIT